MPRALASKCTLPGGGEDAMSKLTHLPDWAVESGLSTSTVRKNVQLQQQPDQQKKREIESQSIRSEPYQHSSSVVSSTR